MSLRELLLALVLFVALGLIVHGVSMWSDPAAFIVAGLSAAGLGVLFLAEAS